MTRAKVAPILATGLAALAAVACSRGAGVHDAAAGPTPAPIVVHGAPVSSRVLPRVLEVTGALTADESADVAAERDGQVASVRVERGSYVEKGAVLATLDDREAKAQLDQARANLAWAKAEVERYAELRRRQVVARAEDQRKATDLELAAASLALAEKGHADCTIRAPFAGVVTEKKISAGAYIRKGSAICGLVKIDPLRAELAIPEAAVSSVQVGQKATLAAQSFPDRTFDATVRYIGPSLRSEARTLIVEAMVPNPRHVLKPGLFVTARVSLPKSEETLLVPADAVVTDSGVSRVFVLGPSRVVERIVSIGERHGDSLEVLSGVAAGERVAVGPDRRLVDGLEIQRAN
ncbi:MAG TPA: efflux RND transporter periplasmic adaptor subunit [Thermoanaerobaculia bacterium]|nr:efflux RND transporter periplasmic adaptor subunit [Thermoanaerobaculia bacterium]